MTSTGVIFLKCMKRKMMKNGTCNSKFLEQENVSAAVAHKKMNLCDIAYDKAMT